MFHHDTSRLHTPFASFIGRGAPVLFAVAMACDAPEEAATSEELPSRTHAVDDLGLEVDDAASARIHLSREEAREFEARAGLEPDDSLVGGVVVLSGEMTEEEVAEVQDALLAGPSTLAAPSPPPSTWCTGYYLKKLGYQPYYWNPNWRLVFADGWGPQTLTLNVSQGVSAGYSANVGISAKVVSAGVGYNVSSSYAVSAGTSLPVPNGKFGRIEAFAYYTRDLWEVWNDDCGLPDDTKVGSGWSVKPMGGVYFRKTLQ